jgi:hypothetical protein
MRASSRELIGLCWRMCKMILDQQNEQGWGCRVIDRLATDLRRELGERRGWTRSNLFSMWVLAAAWPDPQSSNDRSRNVISLNDAVDQRQCVRA